MKFQGKSQRLRERLKLSMPVRVECRETKDYSWAEMSRLIDVTPFGARFALVHMTEVGRLLHLTMPLPRQLRCFDHIEPQYKVWSVVRNVSRHQPQRAGAGAPQDTARFDVGVAFVGKRPPASYEQDPATRYDILSLSPSGTYDLTELKPPDAGARRERGEDTRLVMPLDVIVEVFDEQGATVMREQTVTENISRRGACIWTTLDVARGRFVRLTSASQGLTVTAAVRARRTGPDQITRLHLEFVDGEWPLEGIE